MKNCPASLIIFPAFCLLATFAHAQSGTWVWVNGSDTINSQGNRGSRGVPSVNNNPPGLFGAVQWTDKEGNFWIFGGGDSGNLIYSDLWKYNPTDNTWAWIGGPGKPDIKGNYGSLGVASATNWPGARYDGAGSWTDTAGDFWMFGGYGYDSTSIPGHVDDMDDLWRYHIASGQWTWMSGYPFNGVEALQKYGTLRQPSASNMPPTRDNVYCTWVDSSDNLWFFGGFSSTDEFVDDYNDCWRYNIASGEWTWIAGPQGGSAAVYGTLGVEDPANVPGGRSTFAYWTEGNYLYIAGGVAYSFLQPGFYNDFWRFNTADNYWAWLGGPVDMVTTGQYSDYCDTSGGNMPAGKYEQRSVQVGGCQPVHYVWGGSPVLYYPQTMNDLWSLDLPGGNWRWMSGSDSINPVGNYGTLNVPQAGNMPRGAYGPCFWSGKNGELWLWGGFTDSGYINTMWKYTPDNSCISSDTSSAWNYTLSAPMTCYGDSGLISFSGGSSFSIMPNANVSWTDSLHAVLKPLITTTFTIAGYSPCGTYTTKTLLLSVIRDSVYITATTQKVCMGDTAGICATSGFANYYWNNGSTTACINTTTTDSFYVVVTDSNHCQTKSATVTIGIYPGMGVTINRNGDTLVASAGANFHWLLNDSLLANDTGSFYIAGTPGTYSLQVTDSNGCIENSTPLVITGIESPALSYLIIYPNPANNLLYIKTGSLHAENILIYDVDGQLVAKQAFTPEIDIHSLTAGVYLLEVVSQEGVARKRWVKF